MELAKKIVIVLLIFLLTFGLFFYKNSQNSTKSIISLENKMIQYAQDYQQDVPTRFLNINNADIIAETFQEVSKHIYYLNTRLSYKGDFFGISEIKLSYLYYDRFGKPDIPKLNQVQKDTEAAINEITKIVNKNQSQRQIALQLHDLLIDRIEYDYQNYVRDTLPNTSYTIYGALVLNKAVCDGYSKSYSRLLDEYGIENYLVSVDVMDHSWNLVKINGNWFHVDLTWDDPIYPGGNFYSNISHDYFLISDQKISQDHYGWNPNLPKAVTEN